MSKAKNGIDKPRKARRYRLTRQRPGAIVDLDKRRLDLDRRSKEFLRYEDIRCSIVSDLGGVDVITTAEAQIADRAAFLAMQLERLQIAALNDEKIDLALFGALSDRMRRLLEAVGLRRRAKDVTPDPLTYAASNYPEAAA